LHGQHVTQIALIAGRPEMIIVGASINCALIRTRPPPTSQRLRHGIHVEFRAISGRDFFVPLYLIADVREITFNALIWARFVMSWSVIPSAKYSCSGSLKDFPMEVQQGIESLAAPLSEQVLRIMQTHCADKTVAAPRNSFDETGIVGIVVERLAELIYGCVQAVLKINEGILRQSLARSSSRSTTWAGRSSSSPRISRGCP